MHAAVARFFITRFRRLAPDEPAVPTARCEPLCQRVSVDEVPEVPVLRQPSDGTPSGARGGGGWSAPGAAADAAVGVGSDLPQAAHQRRQPGAPGVICCGGLRLSDRIRCGARTSPTSRCRAGSCTWWRSPAGGCWRGGCPTRWTPSSAWRRWRRRWKATAFRRSSTPSGQPVHQYRLDCWRPRVYAVRWTVAVGVWTTCSSNGCGAP